MMATGDTRHTVSSGNVFADLGLPKSGELLAKAALASQIAEIVAKRGLTQKDAAKVLGTGQPKVSDILSGKLAGVSIERLIRHLNALDRDVRVQVTPKRQGTNRGTLTVTRGSRSKAQSSS